MLLTNGQKTILVMMHQIVTKFSNLRYDPFKYGRNYGAEKKFNNIPWSAN